MGGSPLLMETTLKALAEGFLTAQRFLLQLAVS
jgi:hypothetical protein